jgi:type IX secretion system PorP/SprF family membrane protein
MKRIYLLTALLLPCSVIAQNDLQFSHFMFNEITYNPAATGNNDKLITSLVARQQWIGIENAPSTQFLNAHAYLEQVKGGVGLTVLNDRVGYENLLHLKLNYAYHLRVSEKSTFSTGMSAGFINKKLDGTRLVYEQAGDPDAVLTQTSDFIPDFGFGFEFNTSNLTTGLASTHVSQSLSSSTLFRLPRHYFLYAKYKIKAGEDVHIIPALLVKSSGFIHQYELNTNVVYMNKFWGGITYRYKESLVGMAGFTISDRFRIGYSYDYNAKPVKSYSSGSHEIMLQGLFKGFVQKKHGYKSPRFF